MSFSSSLTIRTHDMHACGEPLRIVTSGYPELKGATVLEKVEDARTRFDHLRKLLIHEPRGHRDMYGAILIKSEIENEFEVLFLNNEGYSPMCGHALFCLGRYVLDCGLLPKSLLSSPETRLVFQCPCGPVNAHVQWDGDKSGRVRFESVPAFVYKMGAKISVPGLGEITLDISFGGAFYAIVSDKELSIDLKSTPLEKIVSTAAAVSDVVKASLPVRHPESEGLSFLYGVIVTDGNETKGPSSNVCVFADKQVDRSPTGSGVTARIALAVEKGTMSLNEEKEFRSILGTEFRGKALRRTHMGPYLAVVVEVSGLAHHTGDHTFYLENSDPFSEGFQLPR